MLMLVLMFLIILLLLLLIIVLLLVTLTMGLPMAPCVWMTRQSQLEGAANAPAVILPRANTHHGHDG